MNIDLGDVTLHVRDQGSGIPVVLLHGWPDTGDLWRHQVPALTGPFPALLGEADEDSRPGT